MNNKIHDVLDFWYTDQNAKKWLKSTPEFDSEIRVRFKSLWESAADDALESWQNTADGCLALCIILDQFPQNMFRGDAKSFQTERLGIQVAKEAIEKGMDEAINIDHVSFLYLPLMHSESLDDQDLCVVCFEKRGLKENLKFAQHHRGLIQEFGRFPHRNKILGRESTPAEIDYLNSNRAFTG